MAIARAAFGSSTSDDGGLLGPPHSAYDGSYTNTHGAEDGNATAPLANPYENHPALSELESAVLYEYHKLASTLRRIQEVSYPLASNATHMALLHSMRVLERKMGLVLTLFKASVWALLIERQDQAEADAAAAAAAANAGSGRVPQ